MAVDLKERKRNRVKDKENELRWDYLTSDFMPFSFHGFTEFVITAIRGIGKSVIAMETIIKLKRKYGYDNVKAYWFRTADDSVKAGLMNNGAKLVSQYVINKYNLELTRHANQIYDHDKLLVEVYPLVSAGKKGKGVEFYDPDFIDNRPIDPKTGRPIKRFIVTVWDEFLMADGIEKRTLGDPVDQYLTYRESIYRDQEYINESVYGINSHGTESHKVTTPADYDFAYNLYLANNVSECAMVTGRLFNYIPDPTNYNVVKLTRQRAVFWNCPKTKNYSERHKNSVNGSIINVEDDPNYELVQKDMSLVKNKSTKLNRVTALLKFGGPANKKTHWFCLYDNKYIRLYNNECVSKDKTYAMQRHIDSTDYYGQIVNNIFMLYDMNELMYADYMSMATFKSRMKLLKSK